ncbi:MAG: PRC-barrel domain containing protein [Planctomycetes bacterium]|nr:PRC-barrel domain containing protein [Planctomycetota bacterium]
MLRSTQELLKYRLDAADGRIGMVKDLYFDDHTWTIRYFVADTGKWLPGRKVLISPASAGEPDWDAGTLPVALTVRQIEDSPPIESHRPVSRRHETTLAGYYGWPAYWTPVGVPAGGMVSAAAAAAPPPPEPEETEDEDPHLRSVGEVTGYRIHATDGEIGHVEEFFVRTGAWIIRYIGVDTRNWLPARKVLISPAWIDRISWSRGEVFVRAGRDDVRDSPRYDPNEPISPRYEQQLEEHYGRLHRRQEAADRHT